MVENPAGARIRGGRLKGGRSALSVKRLISRAEDRCDREEYALALLDLRDVLAKHPEFPDIRNRAGLCRAMLGDAEGALEEFGRAVRVNPDYAEAHLNRALVLNDLTRFDEAREAFARAGALDDRPGDPLPAEVGNRIAIGHGELGDLYMEAEQPAAAVTEYAKALEVRPAFVDLRSQLARALLAMGEVDKAVGELNRVLTQQPSYLDARLRLGTAFRRMGRVDEAVLEWRRCLEMEPQNERARAFLVSAGVTATEARAPETGRERD